jgi:hypothetical protein
MPSGVPTVKFVVLPPLNSACTSTVGEVCAEAAVGTARSAHAPAAPASRRILRGAMRFMSWISFGDL